MIGGHGGNIYALAERLGCRPTEISDMSANVNPLGPMPALMDHLRDNLARITALPQADAGDMVAAFARFHDLDPRQVTAGNGSTELIYRIPRALGAARALVVGPTYADYRDACAMNGVRCDHVLCREADDFRPDMDAIREKAAAADLVFLCNPNNPTGTLTGRTAIEALCRDLPHTRFVIDESYLPFAPQPDAATMIHTALPNVLVLNSMSKAFRIPGLRIGFIKAPATLIDRLTPYALPWSVNSLAQLAVTWLMSHPDAVHPFLNETRRTIESEKDRIEECIHRETAMRCFPSATSFLLMRLPRELDAPAMWRHMADRRILIRDCSNFIGLSERFIRISLRSSEENRRATEFLIERCRHAAGSGASHVR